MSALPALNSVQTPDTFGRRLTALLADRQRSQARLAHLCGYDHSYISRLCNGLRMPSYETVTAIANELFLSCLERAELMRLAGYWPDDAGAALVEALEEAARLGVIGEATYRMCRAILVEGGL